MAKQVQAIKKVSGPQAVLQSAQQLKEQMASDMAIREVITAYIKQNMVEGKDYGSITIKGAKSKPSLFKPGAEKFCGLFKIRPTFKRDDETVEMLGNTPGIIAYICELVDQRGLVIGEGRGTAKTDPKGADFDINKQVKIAQKRAQIDAVLRTGGLSDFFTQDMEDAPKEDKPRPATTKQIDWLRNVASDYGKTMDNAEDIDNWIEQVIGYRPEKLSSKAVFQAVKKIEATKKAEGKPEEQDTVVEVTDEDIAAMERGELPY